MVVNFGMLVNANNEALAAQMAMSHTVAETQDTVDGWVAHVRATIGTAMAALMQMPGVKKGLFGDVGGAGVYLQGDSVTLAPINSAGVAVCGLNVTITVTAEPCGCAPKEETAKHRMREMGIGD